MSGEIDVLDYAVAVFKSFSGDVDRHLSERFTEDQRHMLKIFLQFSLAHHLLANREIQNEFTTRSVEIFLDGKGKKAA